MADVLCVGHASYDIIAYTAGYPAENSKAEVGCMVESGGGPAANAAYLLSYWGANCALAAMIGSDDYATRISKEFSRVDTDLSLTCFSAACRTPVSIILVNTENGSRTIVNRKTPGCALELDNAVLLQNKPSLLLLDGHELGASLQAISAFPEAITVLDAGSRREGTEKLAGIVNHLVCSERFALQMTDLPDLDSQQRRDDCLRALRDISAGTVTVTMGDRGLIYDCGSGPRSLPAYPANAVDTTAAGDIFHGAFAYGIFIGMHFEQSLELASMAASLSVGVAGGRTSIPTYDAVVSRGSLNAS